jgi:g-D-glutamyl-meso-diaminopimelate peptidase
MLIVVTTAFAEQIQPIVETNQPYTYQLLQKDLWQLRANYQLEIETIGQTHFGRKVYAFRIGNGPQNVLLIGSHHGREWITSSLLMKMAEDYLSAKKHNQLIGEYSTAIFNDVSLWVVPMLNPDGVTIQQGFIDKFPYFHRKRLTMMNENLADFTRWKANGVGVDLNRQYPAGWEELPEKPRFHSYQFFKGKRPIEAKEIRAIVQFTERIQPEMAIAYHSSGQEIYWNYRNGDNIERDRKIAEGVSQLTGYKLGDPPKKAVGGGFTDWFITTYQKPAMTIEICPLVEETSPPLSTFEAEWNSNQFVGIYLAYQAKELFLKK